MCSAVLPNMRCMRDHLNHVEVFVILNCPQVHTVLGILPKWCTELAVSK